LLYRIKLINELYCNQRYNTPKEFIMSNKRLVWSDDNGDVRKSGASDTQQSFSATVVEKSLELKLRRLTSGKGRTVIEITGLPDNKKWCEALAKDLKKSLGVGGTYKKSRIELHGEKIEKVMTLLDAKSLKWKKTGG